MSPAWGHVVGLVIVVLMLVFIGIWIWAWLPYHKNDFARLARMPMQDDDKPPVVNEDNAR